jgi:long-chain acyl-CoA synthetase
MELFLPRRRRQAQATQRGKKSLGALTIQGVAHTVTSPYLRVRRETRVMGAVKFENLVEMFERSVKEYGPRDLFGTVKDGNWEWTTYAQVGEMVDAFRGGLAALGIKHGDNVCIISNNRVEWAVAAYACYGLGAALVPMYEAQLPKEWEFIADDCGAVAIIVASEKIYDKAKKIPDAVPSVKHLIKLYGGESDEKSFAAVLAAGRKNKSPSIQPAPKDTACLIYTSGTTGNPKGVILSHGNIASNISAVHGMLPLGGEDRSLSFLPWAHSFGHTCELHTLLSLGASMAICDTTSTSSSATSPR